MKPSTKMLCLLPLLSLICSACSMDSPSQRKFEEFDLSEGKKLRCPVPPPDVIAKGGTATAGLTVTRLGELLKATGGVNLDVERIREDLPSDVAAFREVEFLTCVQYGNGVRTKEEYRAFTDQIVPAYMKNPPVKTISNDVMTISNTGKDALNRLVEACGPSFTTTRPAAKFVPYWASQVENLRENRNIQHYDLVNLMQVRGRTPVEEGSIDPYKEVFFTLDCLARLGYLKVEKFDPPRMVGGRLGENKKIIYLKPLRQSPRADNSPPDRLVEACGPSSATTRPAVKFVRYWASQVENLRENRNIQHYNLETLVRLRGRTPVEQGRIDPYEEVFFTLECLERLDYLKVEKFDPPRMLGGGLVENRKIIYLKPLGQPPA